MKIVEKIKKKSCLISLATAQIETFDFIDHANYKSIIGVDDQGQN